MKSRSLRPGSDKAALSSRSSATLRRQPPCSCLQLHGHEIRAYSCSFLGRFHRHKTCAGNPNSQQQNIITTFCETFIIWNTDSRLLSVEGCRVRMGASPPCGLSDNPKCSATPLTSNRSITRSHKNVKCVIFLKVLTSHSVHNEKVETGEGQFYCNTSPLEFRRGGSRLQTDLSI